MENLNFLKDSDFLEQLVNNNNKIYYVKILVLDQDEKTTNTIEGRVSSGSITIDGNSNVRRAGNISFAALESENDLSNVDNLLSLRNRIKILIGIENNIDNIHDKIIWFKMGTFIITQPSITHNLSGVIVNLNFKDKMCLLNGEFGGGLPTSVTLSEYNQILGYKEIEYNTKEIKDFTSEEDLKKMPNDPNNYTIYGMKHTPTGKILYCKYDINEGWVAADYNSIGTEITERQKYFDIIQTLVQNFGGEDLNRIIINDVPHEIKTSVRYIGKDYLYYNPSSGEYVTNIEKTQRNPDAWKSFEFNEDCGYIYTEFTYAGELVTSIGDNVCTVLDTIVNSLGNYEYFYDVNGNFVFQEKKNYLNTQFDPVKQSLIYSNDILEVNGNTYMLGDSPFILGDYKVAAAASKTVVDENNYIVDFGKATKSIYTFENGSSLISSYSNTPNYIDVRNDFHIWGESEDTYVIHYHVAIKHKPTSRTTRTVVYELNKDNEYTGRLRLATEADIDQGLAHNYKPTDWRAELYMRGLEKKAIQQRPDIYEQELLDLFDSIYNMKEKKFKTDIANNPNELQYWFDFIEPKGTLEAISVDTIGSKVYSLQNDKVKKIYTLDIPNRIIINRNDTVYNIAKRKAQSKKIGMLWSSVDNEVYNKIAIGTVGYSAQEVMRNELYKYIDFNSSISLNSLPIYYLDANTRITVRDQSSRIYGDYLINSITIPLDGHNPMTINASKIKERI